MLRHIKKNICPVIKSMILDHSHWNMLASTLKAYSYSLMTKCFRYCRMAFS